MVKKIEEKEVEETPKGPIRLNLGCGYMKLEGFVNIDIRSEVNPDLVCDVSKGLPYKNGEVSQVRAHDFLEHIELGKTVFVIEEIYRVLMLGGLFDHFTPSTRGDGAFMDPYHRSFWNSSSWLYYVDDAYRALYGTKAKFKIITLEDRMTDQFRNIIHTYGVMERV